MAVPGSPIASTDRGRYSRSGVDEPYEPVVLHAQITTQALNGPNGGDCLQDWPLHDWFQAERKIREG